jgi:hypothetical protein
MILGKLDLIGSRHNQTLQFTGSDTKQLFNLNKRKDWFFNDYDISYSYNDLGHRCKDINNIDLSNYIMFTGCSNTEGIGLKLEHTYPYLVSKKLSCDYYNLAIGSTGLDVLEYNLLTWLQKVDSKPKLVIIQWPDHSRFLSKNPNYESFIPFGRWSASSTTIGKFSTYTIGRFIVNSETSLHNLARKALTENILFQLIAGIPVITLQQSNLQYYHDKTLFWPNGDLARDLIHPGIKSHEYIANLILENIR